MKEENNKIETFERICSHFSTWIIEYRSSTYKKPVFLIWYTDSDEHSTDKLLTFDTGQIFASDALSKIKEVITNNLKELKVQGNCKHWLDSFENLTPVENCIYHVDAISINIKNYHLDIDTLEGLANFTNLFDDFINQDKRNEHLSIYRGNEYIDASWNYFYDSIFWARFNDAEKFKAWDRPELEIDMEKLFKGFLEMRQQFEQKIKLVLS